MGAASTVAKKPSKTGPKPNPEGPRSDMIGLKCRPEFKAWLARFADSERSTPSNLLDQAIAMLAKEKGFEPPPKR